MPSIHFTYSLSVHSLLLPFALALSACTVPKVLGNSPLDDTTTDTSGTTSAPTTTDTGEPPPACDAPGGGEPGGTLLWSREGDELPGFFAAAAINAADELVLAGTVVLSDTDRDVRVEVREADGTSKWVRSYSGEGELMDQAIDVAVDAAGNVHVLLRETILAITGDLTGTTDTRLVVLRVAPDGTLQWRWQQDHPPVAEGDSYIPSGSIGLTGDTIRVLVRAHDEPTLVMGLDGSGAEIAAIELEVPPGLSIVEHALAADGSAFVGGNLEEPAGQHDLWIGRLAPDGSLVWSDRFGDLDDWPTAFVPGWEGDVAVVWSTSLPAGIEYRLRRYDASGDALWTELLPPTGLDSGVSGGALRCDGVLLLTGGTDRPPAPGSAWGMRRELWVGAYTLDGAQLWTQTHAFGEVESLGEGNRVAATLAGDAVVVGSFLGDDGASPVPWLGRFAGG